MMSYSTVMIKPSSFFNSYWLLFQEHKIAFIYLFKNKIMKRFFTLYMNWIMVTYHFLGCFQLWNDTSFLQVGTQYSVWRKIVSELSLPLCSSLILAAFLLVKKRRILDVFMSWTKETALSSSNKFLNIQGWMHGLSFLTYVLFLMCSNHFPKQKLSLPEHTLYSISLIRRHPRMSSTLAIELS